MLLTLQEQRERVNTMLRAIDEQVIQMRLQLAAYKRTPSWQVAPERPDDAPDDFDGRTPYERLQGELETLTNARKDVEDEFGHLLTDIKPSGKAKTANQAS